MYNLAIALGSSTVVFVIGALASTWIAGFIPALITLGVVYFLLARRSGKQVEAIFMRAMALLQSGQVDDGRETILSALPLAKWQFLIKEQVHSQLGQLDYQQACGSLLEHKYTRDTAKKTIGDGKLGEALDHLQLAWSRDWRAQTVRALCLHRLGRSDEVKAVMERAGGGGSSDVLYWGVWAWILNEHKQRDEALQIIGKGLVAIPKAKALLAMQEAFSNKRRPDMTVFGEAWYGFMPDEIPKERLMEMAQAQAAANGQPVPQQPQQRRGPPPKTWPAPRR